MRKRINMYVIGPFRSAAPLTISSAHPHIRDGHISNLDVSLCKLVKILELLYVKE